MVLITIEVGKIIQSGSGVATPYYWVAMVVPIRMSLIHDNGVLYNWVRKLDTSPYYTDPIMNNRVPLVVAEYIGFICSSSTVYLR